MNKFNSPEYLFSLDDLEPHLQRKYFDGLKLTHSPEVAQAMTKEAKPLDSYTAEEREEIAFWLRLVKDWQGYRNKPGANKTDVAAQQKYGVVQAVCKQEDGADAQTEAKALLKTLEQSGSVTGCQGDSRAVSGYALIVQETTTGLFGKFYIESDTHTFTDGKHEMALTLAFSNMMDEKEIENQSQG